LTHGPEGVPFTPEQFVWIWLAFVAFTFGSAALVRRVQGLPFFRPRFRDVEIQQTWRSAASSKGLFGSLAPVNNYAWFTLTGDTLYVGAHFPLNMFMPRPLGGLDLTIPVADISSVSKTTSRAGDESVRVAYQVTDTTRGIVRTENVVLWPKRGDRFFDILREKARVARERRV
jgi:hypothetical protein